MTTTKSKAAAKRKAAVKSKRKGASAPGGAIGTKAAAEAAKGRIAAANGKAKPAAEAKPAAHVQMISVPGAKGMSVAMRKGSKQATMYGLLLSASGASVAEVAKACGYEPGTASSAVHGGRLKRFLKVMGGKLAMTEDEKRGRVFRIVKK